jgi:hypothetical protein
MKIGPEIWGHAGEDKLRGVFSWLARTGLGTHFGGSSIHHYQAVQVAAIEELEERALARGVIRKGEAFEVRVQQGDVQARAEAAKDYARPRDRTQWSYLGSVHEVQRAAHERSYRR